MQNIFSQNKRSENAFALTTSSPVKHCFMPAHSVHEPKPRISQTSYNGPILQGERVTVYVWFYVHMYIPKFPLSVSVSQISLFLRLFVYSSLSVSVCISPSIFSFSPFTGFSPIIFSSSNVYPLMLRNSSSVFFHYNCLRIFLCFPPFI